MDILVRQLVGQAYPTYSRIPHAHFARAGGAKVSHYRVEGRVQRCNSLSRLLRNGPDEGARTRGSAEAAIAPESGVRALLRSCGTTRSEMRAIPSTNSLAHLHDGQALRHR